MSRELRANDTFHERSAPTSIVHNIGFFLFLPVCMPSEFTANGTFYTPMRRFVSEAPTPISPDMQY